MTRDELVKNGYVEVKPGAWAKPNAAGLKDGKLPEKKPSTKFTGHLDIPLRSVSIYLKGDPMPKQSTRFYCTGKVSPGTNSHIVVSYQPKEMAERVKDYQQQLREQLPKDFVMFTQRVHVRKMHFIYPPLKGFSATIMEQIKSGAIIYKETQGDLCDNLKKLPLDAMAGIVYDNDGKIVSEDNVKKYYGLGGGIIIEMDGF